MGKLIDLTNKKFGYLTVISRAADKVDKNGNKIACWNCKCDCGKEIVAIGRNLKSGNTKSCGHLVADTMSKNMKKYNKFVECENYYIGYTNNNVPFYIDKCDYEKIKNICWFQQEDKSICGHLNNEYIYLHRFILDVSDSKIQVDHINHIREDNRRSNIRICTNSLNGMNKGIIKTNTSGYTGVQWEKDRNKWSAFISIDCVSKRIGSFIDIDDAIKARKEAEEKYYREFSYANSVKLATKNEISEGDNINGI